jgi:chemotaxis protein MotB
MNTWRPNRLRTSNEGWLTSYADLITNLLIFFMLIISASEMQNGKIEKIVQSLSKEQTTSPMSLASAKEDLEEVLKEQNLDKQVALEYTDGGLEIAFQSGVMFASGSAEIFESMNRPLNLVLDTIAKYREKYSFAVEGHTDENPIRTQHYKSNWELSSARALVVRDRLENSGAPRGKIRVEAYADTRPLNLKEQAALSQETKLALHRRVVIRIY